jgi:hypothetical protein
MIHTTHFNDCGCISERLAKAEADNALLLGLVDVVEYSDVLRWPHPGSALLDELNELREKLAKYE